MSKFEKGVSVEWIQSLDRLAIESYQVPSIALMENAGKAVADRIQSILVDLGKENVLIACGVGNNAGDGFVVARHLMNAGCFVTTLVIGNEEDLKKDALVNFRILKKCGCPLYSTVELSENVGKLMDEADLIVDAIFGVGLNRKIESPYREFIEAISLQEKFVMSVDVPSGLNGDTGEIWGTGIKANETVTFSFSKKGFYLNQGPERAGKITVVDIGIPHVLFEEMDGH